MIKKETPNSEKFWDLLLTNSKYVDDENNTVLERISEIYKSVKNSNNVLNIGSGQGYFEKHYLYRLNTRNYTDFDISYEGLKKLKKYTSLLTQGSIISLPFKENAFDAVICTEVLEHLTKDDVKKAYQQIHHILDINGYAIFSVPIYEPVSLSNHPVGHKRKYVPNEFLKEISENGFNIVSYKYFYAFRKNRKIFTFLSSILRLRRPSIILVLCKKTKEIHE